MPFVDKCKPCFVAFFWIFMLAGVMLVVSSRQGVAGTPDCGMVNRGLVKSVYAAARKVEYLVDVQGTVSAFCASTEGLEHWEKGLSRAQRNRDYKSARKALIKNAERDLRLLKGRLITLRGWVMHKPKNKSDKTVRIDQINKARNKVLSSVMKMGGYSGQVFILRSGVY